MPDLPDRIGSWVELGGFGLMLAALLGAGYTMLAWVFGWGVRLHDLEEARKRMDKQLELGSAKIATTHDSVKELVVEMKHVQTGQKEILSRINSCQIVNGDSQNVVAQSADTP